MADIQAGIRWLVSGPAAPVLTDPDSHNATTAAEMEQELLRLRKRNEDLQSHVDKLLLLNARSLDGCVVSGGDKVSAPLTCTLDDGLQLVNKPSTNRPRPNSMVSDCDMHSGLHHRRSIVGLAKSKPSHTKDGLTIISSEGPGFKRVHNKYNLENENTQLLGGSDVCSPINAMSIRSDEEDGRIADVQKVDASNSNPTDDDETDEEPENDDASHNKHLLKNKKHPPQQSGPRSPSNKHAFPPFMEQLKDRAGWLIGLLILQSCSSFIIQYNERFLQNHMIIVQFLTMLVGAGGNAGNQASVRVIRSLAVGTLNKRTMGSFLRSEAKMAFSLSILIGMAGFIRAAMFRTPPGETIAVTASVCAIVAISVAIGCTLPLGMRRVHIDPAHSSTSIQVIMDILGVLITVCVSTFVMSFKVFQNKEEENEEDDYLDTK